MPSSADLVRKLLKESGLTWDQIARLFGVSRRAVYLWASGGRLNSANQELLTELLQRVEELPGGTPEEKRRGLLQPQDHGISIFDEIRSRRPSSGPNDINRSPSILGD
jgi:transcriptional regulator with XRE-family HTH domain